MSRELGVKKVSQSYGRPVYEISDPVPLIGHIAFGVIDRGTNVIQVRPSTLCQHGCIFCSVDAGPASRYRQSEFLVDVRWLSKWVVEVAKVKGRGVEVLLDGVGEPLTHPRLPELIELVKGSGYVDRVALETHGGGLSKETVMKLQAAGLDRINLSVDAVSRDVAASLVGVEWYDPAKLLELAAWTLENTEVDVVLTPVVVPGYNEDEIKALIEWARRHGAGRKSGWPTGVLVQKYEVHKYGRKVAGVREWSWSRFYAWLRKLEKETGYRLVVEPEEIGIERRPRIEPPYSVGEKVKAIVLCPGWHVGETLVADVRGLRVMAVLGAKGLTPGSQVGVTVVSNEDNIYVARAVAQ
ncbi:MAG: radical SAM protein [Sulfolobales archaeon]